MMEKDVVVKLLGVPGYAPTGVSEILGTELCSQGEWGHVDIRFELRKAFAWAPWLKGRCVFRYPSGNWYLSLDGIPRITDLGWDTMGSYIYEISKIVDLFMPDIEWRNSLILNPNWKEK